MEQGGEKHGIGISDNPREGNLVGALVCLPHVSKAEFGRGHQQRSFSGRPDKDPIPNVGIVTKVGSLREEKVATRRFGRCKWMG